MRDAASETSGDRIASVTSRPSSTTRSPRSIRADRACSSGDPPCSRTESATARYRAPESRKPKPSARATPRATVLLPAPAGPSIATTTGARLDGSSRDRRAGTPRASVDVQHDPVAVLAGLLAVPAPVERGRDDPVGPRPEVHLRVETPPARPARPQANPLRAAPLAAEAPVAEQEAAAVPKQLRNRDVDPADPALDRGAPRLALAAAVAGRAVDHETARARLYVLATQFRPRGSPVAAPRAAVLRIVRNAGVEDLLPA